MNIDRAFPGVLRRRDALRVMAACLADWWLPRRVFGQTLRSRKPDRRVIVVTFGGGVRYEDTLAPEGWVNIPHLAGDLVRVARSLDVEANFA